MLKTVPIPIAEIHVPVKRTKTLEAEKVAALAEDILENGQTVPIRVRADGKRFVLIEGYHRLEALRALGEADVAAFVVQARQH
jgi:ParB-like chromosome segregation protein Spo0J